ELVSGFGDLGGGILAGMFNFGDIPLLSVSEDISNLQVIAVPPVGLPTAANFNVQLNPNGVNNIDFTVPIPPPPPGSSLGPPELKSAGVAFTDPNLPRPSSTLVANPLVVLTGYHLTSNNPLDPTGLGSHFT